MAAALSLAVGACRSADDAALPDGMAGGSAPPPPPASPGDGATQPTNTSSTTSTAGTGTGTGTGAGPTSTALADADADGTVNLGGPARFVARGPADRAAVALTFHTNGDVGLATALLDRLTARRVPITAFVVGEWLDAQPELARRLIAEGHELANHTWSHPSMGELDEAAITEEIVRCAEVVRRYSGGPGRWFRPSAMEVPTDAVLAAAGRAGYATVVGYSLDSLDFTDPGAAAVGDNVISSVAAGDIVSLHFGHRDTVEAIDPIIEHLQLRSLRPVTLATLLGAR